MKKNHIGRVMGLTINNVSDPRGRTFFSVIIIGIRLRLRNFHANHTYLLWKPHHTGNISFLESYQFFLVRKCHLSRYQKKVRGVEQDSFIAFSDNLVSRTHSVYSFKGEQIKTFWPYILVYNKFIWEILLKNTTNLNLIEIFRIFLYLSYE